MLTAKMAPIIKRLEKLNCEVRFVGTTDNAVKAVISDVLTKKKVAVGTSDTNENALDAAMVEFAKVRPTEAAAKTEAEIQAETISRLVARVDALEAKVSAIVAKAKDEPAKEPVKEPAKEPPKEPAKGDKGDASTKK